MAILDSTFDGSVADGATITLPAGLAEGNIITLVCYASGGPETMSISGGYAQLDTGTGTGSTYYVFQKEAGASEPDPTFTTTRTSSVSVFTSDGATGGAVVGTIYTSSSTSSFVHPDATAVGNVDVVRVALMQLSGRVIATPPTGTELFDNIASNAGQAAWATTAAAGSVGTDTTTITTSGRGAALTILLEPAASGLTIDSTDASMQRNTNFQVVCSTPTTTPTTGNTTLTNGNDMLTPSSVTGSDPYTLTFPVGDLSKQVDGTGYDWTLEITP